MQQFEIKIFANPSGFQELKLKNTENLFTQKIVERRNFDGDFGIFKDGTFSVLFMPNAFIIDYIFNVVADAGFRDPQTHIAIAIERGCALQDAYRVFMNLRKEFNVIAATHKTNLATQLYNQTETFNRLVEQNLVFASDQFRISAKEMDITKAIVSYDTEEQLKSLLENPNRKAFGSYSLVYYLKQIDAQNLYSVESIRKLYGAIKLSDEDFQSNNIYEVVFPDNHVERISSRADVIDYLCTKPYYKSEHFKGSLQEHMDDWKVRQSDDHTQFIIGKDLIPQRKDYRIECVDSNGNNIDIPYSLDFRKGRYDRSNNLLSLFGAEVVEMPDFSYDPKKIRIEYLGKTDDVIRLRVIELYCYELKEIFNTDQDSISGINIYKKNGQLPLATLTKYKSCYYTDIRPEDLEYEIPETKKYTAIRAGFKNDCRPCQPKYKKKDTASVILVIKNKTIIDDWSKHPVSCYYNTASNSSNYEYLYRKEFDENGRLELKDLPFGKFEYCIQPRRYRAIKDEINITVGRKTPLQIDLRFRRTIWSNILIGLNKLKGYLLVLIIGLVGGFFSRPYIHKSDHLDSNNNRDTVVTNAGDDLQKEINKLNAKNQELSDSVKYLKEELAQVTAIEVHKQSERNHPDLVSKIIYMTYKEKDTLSWSRNDTKYEFYRGLYNRLNSQEKQVLNSILNDSKLFAAFKTISKRSGKYKNVTTFDACRDSLTADSDNKK